MTTSSVEQKLQTISLSEYKVMDASDVKVTPDLKHVLKTMVHLLLNGEDRYHEKPMYEDLQNMSRKHYVQNRDIIRASDSHWVEAHINMFYFRQMCLKTGAIAAAGTPSKYLRMLFKGHKRISKGQYFIEIDWLLALVAGVDDNHAFVALRDRIVRERETNARKVPIDFEEFPPANAVVTNTMINDDGSVAQGKGKITTTNIRKGRKSPGRKAPSAAVSATTHSAVNASAGRRTRRGRRQHQAVSPVNDILEQNNPMSSSSSSSSSSAMAASMVSSMPVESDVASTTGSVSSPEHEYDSDNDTLPDSNMEIESLAMENGQPSEVISFDGYTVNDVTLDSNRKRNRQVMESAFEDWQQRTQANVDDLEAERSTKRFAGVSSTNQGQGVRYGANGANGAKPEAVPMWDVMSSMTFAPSDSTIDQVWQTSIDSKNGKTGYQDEFNLNDNGLWKSIAEETASMSSSSSSSPMYDNMMAEELFEGFDGFESLQAQDTFDNYASGWLNNEQHI
eukprot:TRINITY_DN127_c0_g1_i6.p1 TRINITY_DN127_c0_g1~~TRINITY_DN127_c0_g1_i6.p1  ORF type:complete len:517 (-),score=157.95 TRINITY_DN127_c0_g1_i6:547-2067(-)